MTTSSEKNGLTGGLFFLGLFLALGLLASTYLVTRTIRDVRSAGQTIRVKGYAEMKVTSDRASWNGRFIVRGDDLARTYRSLHEAREKVLQWMKKEGVPEKTLQFSPATTNVRYIRDEQGYETSEIESYILEQSVTLKTENIPLVSRIARESSSLISDGVEFISYNPSYFFSGLEGLKLELLSRATSNAMDRAQRLAGNSGSEVGRLVTASQGVFQITPVDSTAVSDYGRYDTTTIDKLVKAVVTMQYGITHP